MKAFFTRAEVIALLKRKLKGKSLPQLGRELGGDTPVSPGYLNDVMKGRKRPGPKILAPLGLAAMETEETYRRIR